MSLAPGPRAASTLLMLLLLAPTAHAQGSAQPAQPSSSPPSSSPPSSSPPSSSPPNRAEQARQAALAGRTAFDAGDHAGALAHFETARALRPSPKVLYNIGVCHMRLYRQAAGRGDEQAEARHAAAAVDAFNAYLRERPNAEDRVGVEDMVRALGGTPSTQAQLRDPLRPLATSPPAAPDIKRADPPAPAPPPVAPVKPVPSDLPRPRGYLGVLLGLAVQPQLTARSDLHGGVAGLLALRGGARLGPRRRVELGGQIAFAAPGAGGRPAPALSTTTVLLDAGHTVPLGRARRVELPYGGLVGLVRETLRIGDGQPRPACALQGGGALLGARTGGVLGGRVGFAVLVGARRHHELGMQLTLAFHGFGPGPSAPACDAPGRVLQNVPRARFMMTGALGYAFRF